MLVRIARIFAVEREPTTRTVSPGLSFFTLSCHPLSMKQSTYEPPDSRFACYSKQKSSCPFSGYTSLPFCLRFRVNT